MVRRVESGGNTIYHLSSGLSISQQASKANEKAKSKKPVKVKPVASERLHVELLEHFEFTSSCQAIDISLDGTAIAACGLYPPCVKLFNTEDMSLRHTRALRNEAIQLQFLEEDYRKFAVLETQRYVEIHNQGGLHHRLRIPMEGRAMQYDSETSELFFVGTSNDIHRLDLELGSFKTPMVSSLDELNFVEENPVLPLLITGGLNGTIEAFDTRTSQPISKINCSSHGGLSDMDAEITCASFHPQGFKLAVGSSNGCIYVYDIRTSKPYATMHSKNFLPTKKTQWVDRTKLGNLEIVNNLNHDFINKNMEKSTYTSNSSLLNHTLVTLDNLSVCFWEIENTDYTNKSTSTLKPKMRIEAVTDGSSMSSKVNTHVSTFNSFLLVPNTGVVFTACEAERIGVFYCPNLGPAPKWCSHLEKIDRDLNPAEGTDPAQMDEMETFKNFKFVPAHELQSIGAFPVADSHVIRPYMHGYFIRQDIWNKLKALTDPFDHDNYVKDKRSTLKSRPKRIILDKSATVNVKYAEKLQRAIHENDESNIDKQAERKAEVAQRILSDTRFQKLFHNPDFVVDGEQ